MRSVLRLTLRVFVPIAMLALAATQSQAQCTGAPGPYYVPPSWSQSLTAITHFIVLSNFGCLAVLDRETGLVWEQSPNITTFTWLNALDYCTTKVVNGKVGWRLPTVEELGSLVGFNPGVIGVIGLPLGNPFSQTVGSFWSSTTWVSNSTSAWYLQQPFAFPFGAQSPLQTTDKPETLRAWCVRAGTGIIAAQ